MPKKQKTKKVISNSLDPWVIIGVIGAIALLVLGVSGTLKPKTGQSISVDDPVERAIKNLFGVSQKTTTLEYSGEKMVIVEYSDFECPFCKKAHDGALKQIRQNFGDAVVIEYKHFPLSFHANAQKAAEASECAREQGKFWEYHDKLFENQKSLGVESLKQYAKELGLNTQSFNACLDDGVKAQLVRDQFLEGQSKGVSGTPAFFIGDSMISGAQPYENFLPVICAKIPQHDACVNAPQPVDFKMYVIQDQRCKDCDASRIVAVTRQLFPGVSVKYLDYSSKEGKELYDQVGLVFMPMYVMEASVEDDPAFSRIAGALRKTGDYYAILPQASGSSFDPNAEICTNGVDDNNDGIVDCDDAKCAASLECREEKPGEVQLFIMSDCPFGKKAVEGLSGAIDNFGDALNYDIHYIASEAGDGFNSLHGQYEWEENVRQLCAKKLAPDTYFDYVYCRSTNGVKGVDWKSCATSSGLDVNEMQACFDGEGKDLLREDIKIANALQVSASPTWLANNRYKFSGVDAETVRKNFCQYNVGVAGCENTLQTETTVPTGAGCS
ncbi:thioredoxin domain-containing protein [Candidatus Woesearchaeota archaeon]|nr:thioredoxin domain-containing protein [Candidatus Woesearchaeota archaeon]